MITPSDVLDAWDNHREKLSHGHQFALLYVAAHPVTTDVAEWLTRAVESDLAGRLLTLYVDPSPSGGVMQVAVERALVVELLTIVESAVTVADEMDLAGGASDSLAQRPGRLVSSDRGLWRR